ncbi:hypothetical protein ACVIHH_008116 [Bradyrhizobium sp. USDA 4518]
MRSDDEDDRISDQLQQSRQLWRNEEAIATSLQVVAVGANQLTLDGIFVLPWQLLEPEFKSFSMLRPEINH